MSKLHKLGTIVRVADGRIGTVVFNSIIGVGLKWGRHKPDAADFEGTTGNLVRCDKPEDWPWKPDALLRDPNVRQRLDIECVGEPHTVEILDE